MATESLIVKLDAKTAALDSKLSKTEKKVDQLDNSVKKTEIDLAKMSRTAVIGITAATAVITASAKAAATWARELEVAAKRSGETVEQMQSLAFASSTVGISLERLGDISKDTNEKIGEFTSTGGGGFVDFVDVMKLSTSEAQKLAAELSTMSGPAVLQEMVRRMEEAGISSNQMSFALEGVASDATDLIPLLQDNGKELNRLQQEFESLGNTLSQEQIDNLKRVGEELDKLSGTFSSESKQLIADYSDEIITAINAIKTLAIGTTDAFNLIATGWGSLIELAQAALTDLVNGTDTFADTLQERTQMSIDAMETLLGTANKGIEIVITEGNNVIKKSVKQDELSYKQKLDIFSKYTKAASIINSAFLEDNKAVQAGIIVADTATGIMRAFATSSNIYEAYANAAVVAATGVAQLANLQSATKGGGSINSSTGTSSSVQQPPPENFEQESTGLQVSDATSGGSQTFNIQVPDGDEIGEAIANWLNKGNIEGRI